MMVNRFYLLILAVSILYSCDKEDSIRGNVVFSDIVKSKTNEIIEGATISIYAGNKRFSNKTDFNGIYNLVVPFELFPDSGYISLNISHPLHRPTNVVYKLPLKPGKRYSAYGLNSALELCPDCLEIIDENYSELFHLGDDKYGGSINSQFQKLSDGLELQFYFKNLKEFKKLKLSFFAKGIQSTVTSISNVVLFGDDKNYFTLSDGPMDGSFKYYSFETENKFEYDKVIFRTQMQAVFFDYDDWEFTSFNIEGIRE